MLAKAFKVQFGRVAFVLRKTVFRIFAVEVEHEAIAGNFRDDAGGGDGEAEGVAVNERGLLNRKRSNGQSIDQHVIRSRSELNGGGTHGFVRGAEDVQLVDVAMSNDGDRTEYIGARDQLLVETPALEGRELFGIAQDVVVVVTGKDDCGGHDRSSEGTAPGFVDSGYK
jgi:hypothetical protein